MVAGEIKPEIVYETTDVLAFRDINPKAPVHVLVIPKRHIATLNELGTDSAGLPASLLMAVQEVAHREKIDETGYRTVINCGSDGGQEVYHLHVHVLGGRQLLWPPG